MRGNPLHRPTIQIQPINEAGEAEQQSRPGQSSLQQFTLAVGEKVSSPTASQGRTGIAMRDMFGK